MFQARFCKQEEKNLRIRTNVNQINNNNNQINNNNNNNNYENEKRKELISDIEEAEIRLQRILNNLNKYSSQALSFLGYVYPMFKLNNTQFLFPHQN